MLVSGVSCGWDGPAPSDSQGSDRPVETALSARAPDALQALVQERTRLKEEIKQELLMELKPRPSPIDSQALARLKTDLKDEIIAELQTRAQSDPEADGAPSARFKEEIKREVLRALREAPDTFGLVSKQELAQLNRDLERQAQERFGPVQERSSEANKRALNPEKDQASANLADQPSSKRETNAPGPGGLVNRESRQQASPTPVDLGSVEGRMLRNGKPLAGCRVKLVRMEESRFMLLKSVRYGIEFEGMTDLRGQYRFIHIPVGIYRIKWLVPGEDAWTRRLKDGPDAKVKKDQTSVLKAIETAYPIVSE